MELNSNPSLTEVVEKLTTLGTTEAMALYFESEGILGEKCNPNACPIANYARRETGAAGASASGWGLTTYDIEYNPITQSVGEEHVIENHHLASASGAYWLLSGFMDAFDKGRFPELEVATE